MNHARLDSYRDYFGYLQNQSTLGAIYRTYLLYPFLSKQIDSTFLDVGCGVGFFLAHGSRESVGLDVNPYCVDYVRKNGLNSELISSDGSFPLRDNSFKSVVCDQVLEHLEQPDRLLTEIDRVLIPGGTLLIGLPLKKGFVADSDHKHFYTLNGLIEAVRLFCPSVSYSRHFYFPLPFRILGDFFSWQYLYVVFTS